MKRKLLSGLLCLALCLAFLPAAQAEEEEEPRWAYTFYDPDTMSWGLKDYEDFSLLLPAEYGQIGSFTDDGYAEIQKGGLWGIVDYKGNFALPVEYSNVSLGEQGIAAVAQADGGCGYVRVSDGMPITDFCFQWCEKFYKLGVCYKVVEGRELYGAVNAQGETVIPFEYDYLTAPPPSYSSLQFMFASKDGCAGAFDPSGNLLRRCIYPNDAIMQQSLTLPAQMTEEEEMSALIAASQTWEVEQDPGSGLWGYRFRHSLPGELTDMDWAFRPNFLSAQPFDETGHAQVTLEDGQIGTIDQSGTFTPAPLNDRFSDVLAGSWYNKGVTTCAEKGVMVGTGEGLFSPNDELTDPECLTLALRLYDLQRGGDGTLETAPEDYGHMTFTLSDGKTFYRYGAYDPFFNRGQFHNADDDSDFYAVYVQAPGETPEEREAYAKAHEGTATFVAEGKTYSGTVVADSLFYGPCLRFIFDYPEAERPDLDALFDHSLPAPDKWYRDAVYTARQWGLDTADGFSVLVDRATYQPSLHYTERNVFARALAVAAGELEKRYDVPLIPDMKREYSESLYNLYEAGILNGTDSFGTFRADKDLTRAECATMVARVLDPAQRLASPPATPDSYQQAIISLRTGVTYLEESEKTYETDHCTVFVYDRGGAMYSPRGNVTLIYKPGSALEAGTRINCPIPNPMGGTHRDPPEVMALSEDRKTFTYSYYYEDKVHTCVVDLTTGQTAESDSPITYENQLALMTQAEGYTIEQQLEAPGCTVVLRWKPLSWWDDTRDYRLDILPREGSGKLTQLLLPSTVSLSNIDRPTDRAPDRLSLSEDGKSLTYTYHFDEALEYEGEVLHEAGDYTYTADLTTGEVTASIDPLSQLNLSYWAILGSLETEEGYEKEYSYHYDGNFWLPDGVDTVLRSRPCLGYPSKRDFEFYLVRREAQPQLLRLSLPSTELLSDGSAPTTREPDSIKTYSDPSDPGKVALAYTYRFTQPLWDGSTMLHDKGTYTYTVDVLTGEQSAVLEDSYWKALADVTQDTENHPFQLERKLETDICTVVQGMTKALQYPRAVIALVYKDGTSMGAGEVVYLPTLSGSARYNSIPPHSLELSDDGTTLTYSYHFDENQYAMTLTAMSYLNHKAGTYTYTVDLATGEVNEEYAPKE